MERADIEKLFTFTDYSWRLYEETIRPLGDELVTKPAPGSGWPALRDALGHINWAYVRWLADSFATTDGPVERVTSWENSTPNVTASVITLADISTRSTTTSFRRRAR